MTPESQFRLSLLSLAVQGGLVGSEAIDVAQQYEDYALAAAAAEPVPAPAPKAAAKPAKAAAKTPPAAATAVAGKAVEPPAAAEVVITTADVTNAVIALVNAGNKAAGDDKTGRQYAAAVLQPYGAKNVSTVKPEDYAKVIEALQAKQAAIEAEAEADIAG